MTDGEQHVQAPFLKKRRGMRGASYGNVLSDAVFAAAPRAAGKSFGQLRRRAIVLEPVESSNAESITFPTITAACAFLKSTAKSGLSKSGLYGALRSGKAYHGWYIKDNGLKVGTTTTYIGGRTETEPAVSVVPARRDYSCTGALYSPTALAAAMQGARLESSRLEATVTVGDDDGKIAFYDSATCTNY